MRIAIHQPEHLPWLGYFHRMLNVDTFVILDTVQYEKENFQNRNKILCPNKDWTWVGVPINLSGFMHSTIRDMKINDTQANWKEKYWNKVSEAYRKHSYFDKIGPELKEIIFSNQSHLLQLNMDIIHLFRQYLEIQTPIMYASSLNVTGRKTELLLSICKKLNASSYVSGMAGKTYLDINLFNEAGIEVSFHSFTYPDYPSLKKVPYLSTLDLLMNCGNTAKQYLL